MDCGWTTSMGFATRINIFAGCSGSSRSRRRPGKRRFYVVAEKILADGERFPRFAGVVGTTGYEWLNVISRVPVDDRGLAVLEERGTR